MEPLPVVSATGEIDQFEFWAKEPLGLDRKFGQPGCKASVSNEWL